MATTTLDAMFPEVTAQITGSPPRDLLWFLAGRVLREWCRITLAWKVEIAAIPLALNTASYVLTYPANVELVALMGGTFTANTGFVKWIEPTSEMELRTQIGPQWRNDLGNDVKACLYLLNDYTTLWLYPKIGPTLVITPFAPSFTPRFAVQPVVATASQPVDSRIFNLAYEALVEGTLAELYKQNKRPWSDAKLYVEHRARFVERSEEEALRVVKDGNRAPIVAVWDPYGGTDMSPYDLGERWAWTGL
jgi:hypothetical protein